MSEYLQTRLETRDQDRLVYVDKYDDNELWLSIQVKGGNANCVLSREQAVEMIAAIERVLAAEGAAA